MTNQADKQLLEKLSNILQSLLTDVYDDRIGELTHRWPEVDRANIDRCIPDIEKLFQDKIYKERFEEVKGFAGTNRSNKKFCDHYETRYKFFSDKLASNS